MDLVFAATSMSLAAPLPFEAAPFEAAHASGRPVVVQVDAPWCRACARQTPVIEALLSRPEMKDYAHFTVDFDKQKTLLRKLGVHMEGTLIVYKRGREVARSTGQTDTRKIAALLQRGL